MSSSLILSDNNITLRPFEISDAGKLAKLCNNINVWKNLRDAFPHPYHKTDAKTFITRCQREKPPVTFAIDYSSELAGAIGLVPQQDVYRLSAELGFWIGEPFWNRGIASRAVSLIVAYGFNPLGLVRIFSSVFDFNTASQRVLEKAGFTLESIAVKAVIKNNKIVDEYRYALIKRE